MEAGLRAAAIFEALKGALVIVTGCGLLALIHRDAQAFAEHLVRHMHLNPARHYPRVFIEAAGRLTDSRLRTLAVMAFAYATLRFAEAYGLWRARAWAEWLAIISGAAYLPVEVYELARRVTAVRALALVTNAALVIFISYARYRTSRVHAERPSGS
jgi:uncharacterized membrane protein (DUF2068 family)